jgi:membrane protease subunit HflK
MKRWSVFLLTAVGAILIVLAAGFHVVGTGEQIVVRRFGRVLLPTWGPGLHWGFPLGIDRFDRVRTDLVRRLSVGSPEAPQADADPSDGEFLTGDLNLVRVKATVQYRVEAPADFVVQAEEAESMLRRLADAGLSGALARRGIDAVLRVDRQRIAQEVEGILEQAVGRHRLGLAILGVNITEARPPSEVASDFVAAQSAESERSRRLTEAQTYAETTATAAKASSQAIFDAAHTSAQRTVVSSKAEAQRYLTLVVEARRSPVFTAQRIYLDAMNSLLSHVRRKVILPPGDAVDLTVLGLEE